MFTVHSQKIKTVHPKLRHTFFGRQGGASEGIYDSLNIGAGSDDTIKNIKANKAIVTQIMGVETDTLITLYQVHSADCLTINAPLNPTQPKPQADGMVTDKAGIALGALSADCTPLLFAGTKADGTPVIGAAHSGWGGSLKGIGETTIDKMLELGAILDTIHVAIGPCIQQASYEVSDNFKAPFIARDDWAEAYFIPSTKSGHLMFDMPNYIAKRLEIKGLQHIEVTGHDTYTMEEEFFSYRRKTHRNDPDYGRQISVIVIEE